MEIISVKEAKLRGQNWYFTGKSCKNGHLCKRYIKGWVCAECKLLWENNNYHKNPSKQREREKRYRNNIGEESYKNKITNWKNKNKDYLDKQYKEWKDKNIDSQRKYHRDYQKYKRDNNPYFRLSCNVKGGIYNCLKGRKNNKKWTTFVDFTLDQLIAHLEANFDKNMTWDNYGKYWHVDHIKPLSRFDLEIEFKKAWDLNNLQPLEAIENIKKGNKYIE